MRYVNRAVSVEVIHTTCCFTQVSLRRVGETVPVENGSNHRIRVFPLLPVTQAQPRLRSNITHDELIARAEKTKIKDKQKLHAMMRGHAGPCALRPLKYFDVGHSFLSDSLHNIYHGVMVSPNEKFSATRSQSSLSRSPLICWLLLLGVETAADPVVRSEAS